MAVFRRIFDITKAALFALMFVFVSVFPQKTFADGDDLPYFVMRIRPDEVVGSGYEFNFAISAAGCYDVYWECDNTNDPNDPSAGCTVTNHRSDNLSAGNNLDISSDVNVSHFTKPNVSQKTISKQYTDDTERYVKIVRKDNCQYRGYADSRSAGVLMFSVFKNGTNPINTSLLGVNGSLARVFPRIKNGVVVDGSDFAIIHPSFMNVFQGCVNLEGPIPEYLFKTSCTSETSCDWLHTTEGMFASTFAGCFQLSGSIPANLFNWVHGDVVTDMFNGTFVNCHALSGDIPVGLFKNIVGYSQSQMFYSTFAYCENLTGIPTTLFSEFGAKGNADAFQYGEKAYHNTFAGCTGIKYLYSVSNNGTINKIHYLPSGFFGKVNVSAGVATNVAANMFLGVPDYDGTDGIAETGETNDTADAKCKAVVGNDFAQYIKNINTGLYRDASDQTTKVNTRKLTCTHIGSGGQGETGETPVQRTLKFYRNCYSGNLIDEYSSVNEYGVHEAGWHALVTIPEDEVVSTDEETGNVILTQDGEGVMFTATVLEGDWMPQTGKDKNGNTIQISGSIPKCNDYMFLGYMAPKKSNGVMTKIKDGIEYYDDMGRRVGERWNTVTNNETDYVELYAVWGPQIYKLSFDNNFPGYTSNRQAGPAYIWERYGEGLYKTYNTLEKSLSDSVTSVPGPLPSAYGAEFKGYNTSGRLVDELDVLANGSLHTYNISHFIVSGPTTYKAVWEKRNMLKVICGNNENKLITDIVSNPTTTTTIPISSLPNETTVKTVCNDSDYSNNERKELAWECSGATRTWIYKNGNYTYLEYNSYQDSHNIVCKSRWVPKVYPIELDSQNGDQQHNMIYYSGMLNWSTQDRDHQNIYNEEFYQDYSVDGVVSNPLWSEQLLKSVIPSAYLPTHSPIGNEYAQFDGFYTEPNGGGEKVINADGEIIISDAAAKRLFNNSNMNNPTKLYANYLDATTQYQFKCYEYGPAALSGEVINNQNSTISTAKHACIGGVVENGRPVFSAQVVCNTPTNPKWDCKRVFKNGTYDVNSVEYNPLATGGDGGNSCNHNQIDTLANNSLVVSVECVAQEQPPAYQITLNKTAGVYGNIIEKYGVAFYGSEYTSDLYSAHRLQEKPNIFITTSVDMTDEDIEAQYPIDSSYGSYNSSDASKMICSSSKPRFVGYYGTLNQSQGNQDDLTTVLDKPYVWYNGKIVASPLDFPDATTLSPTCLENNNYFLSLFCDDPQYVNNSLEAAKIRFSKETINANNFSLPVVRLDPTATNNAEYSCPQSPDKINNGKWKCDIYTFNGDSYLSPDNPNYHDPAEPFISGIDYDSNNPSNLLNGIDSTKVYRIDCYAQWINGTFEVILHGDANVNNNDLRTTKLYGAFTKGLFYDSELLQSAATLLETKNNGDYSFVEPTTDGMSLFNGFTMEENGNDIINPRWSIEFGSQSTGYNGDSYNNIIYHRDVDNNGLLKNIDLYINWMPVYKITLNPNIQDGENIEFYTNNALIYSDKDFKGVRIGDTANLSNVEMIANNSLPTKRGYTLDGYFDENDTQHLTKFITGDLSNEPGHLTSNGKTTIKTTTSDIVWAANWVAKTLPITLNDNVSSVNNPTAELKIPGPGSIYLHYDDGFYSNVYTDGSANNNSIVSINKPKLIGYDFLGYFYTDPNDSNNKITCVDENGNIQLSNNDFDEPITCDAEWSQIDCTNRDPQTYFDDEDNVCKTCPANFPNISGGILTDKSQCHTTIVRYNKIENLVDQESAVTFNKSYTDELSEEAGYPISGVLYDDNINGYAFTAWHSAADENNELSGYLHGESTNVYAYYEPKGIKYNLYCDDPRTNQSATVVESNINGTFNRIFAISGYVNQLKTTCSSIYNSNDFTNWTCYDSSRNNITKNTINSDDDIVWDAESDGPNIICFANWTPAKFYINLNYENETGGIESIYAIPGTGFYDSNNQLITSIVAPGYESHIFKGYCLDNDPGNTNCSYLIDLNGQFTIDSNNNMFTRGYVENLPDNVINLYAKWEFVEHKVNLDYNGGHLQGKSETTGALYIDPNTNSVSVTDKFGAGIIGIAESGNTITIGKDYLPIKKNGDAYYAFNGYKNQTTNQITVNSNGTLTESGIYDLRHLPNPATDNPPYTTWVAQWKAIYRVNLNINEEEATSVAPEYFYTDKENIYSEEFLVDDVLIGQNRLSLPVLTTNPELNGFEFYGFGINDNNYIDKNGNLTAAGSNVLGDISTNVTWNAQWKANVVEIVLTDPYNPNRSVWEKYADGFYSSANTSQDSKLVDNKITPPTHRGYTFMGYFDVSDTKLIDADGSIRFEPDKYITGPVEFHAVWTANGYEVRFNKNAPDNEVRGNMSNQSFVFNEAQALSQNGFSRAGYDFGGWCDVADCNGENIYENREIVIDLIDTGIKDLYAKWNPIHYNIEYRSNGGEGTIPETYKVSNIAYDEEITFPATEDAFTRGGYTFEGWCLWNTSCLESDAEHYVAGGSQKSKLSPTDGGTVPVYARWSENTYNVAFNANGGIGEQMPMYDEPKYYTDQFQLRRNTYTKHGHNFAGWCKEYTSCDDNVAYDDQALVSRLTEINGAIVNMYARWTPADFIVTYHIDDNRQQQDTFYYSDLDQDKTPTDPTKEGYEFIGWCDYNPNTGGNTDNDEDCPATVTIRGGWAANKDYYAQWKLKKITCAAGEYLPAGRDQCALCDKNAIPVTNGWCPGTRAGDVWTISNENQGVEQCPEIINETNAAAVKNAYLVADRIGDSNNNSVKDRISDCGAIFGYTSNIQQLGVIVDGKLGKNIITNNPAEGYMPSAELNQNVAWAAANCWYNETSQRYDNCLPADWMGVVCEKGYYISSDELHQDNQETMNFSAFRNICKKAEAGWFTNIYDLHKGINESETNRVLAEKVGVAVENGEFKDVINGNTYIDDKNLYRKCSVNGAYPKSDVGAWKMELCYATVEYKDNFERTLYPMQIYPFSGFYNGISSNSYSYVIGDNLPIPESDGYTDFQGWYIDAEFENPNMLVTADSQLKGNKELYPLNVASERTMKIWFRKYPETDNVNNMPAADYYVECVMNQECKYSCGGPGEAECPSKDEYDPVIWNLKRVGVGVSFPGVPKAEGGLEFDLSGVFDHVMDAQDTTLYARFLPTEYQIEYVLKDGVAENPSSYNVETQPFTLNNPVKVGNTFIGWCVNEDNCAAADRHMSYELPNNSVERNKDVPLVMYAMYEPMPYRVDFNENGGVGTKGSIFCRYGEDCDVSNENEVAWENHEFLGWDRNQNAFTPEFPQTEEGIHVNILTESPNERVALYAIWSRDEIDLRYVYKDESNTVSITTCKMSEGTFNLPVLHDYLKPGYRFFGWRVSDSAGSDDEPQVVSYISDYTQQQCYDYGFAWCVSSRYNPLTGRIDTTETCATSCGTDAVEIIPAYTPESATSN